jgi:hypothetical protein
VAHFQDLVHLQVQFLAVSTMTEPLVPFALKGTLAGTKENQQIIHAVNEVHR